MPRFNPSSTPYAPPPPAPRRCASAAAAPRIFTGSACKARCWTPRALSGIISYEPSELVVTVRGGTPLAELEAALAEQGQCLPFEPPRFGPGGTVGGMVAAGLSGPARASVGAVRDYVLGLQAAQWPRRIADLRRPGHEERGRLRPVAPDGRRLGHAGRDHRGQPQGAAGGAGRGHAEIRMRPGRGPAPAQRLGRPAAAAQRQLLGATTPASARCTCACAARWRRSRRPAAPWAASARTTPRRRPTGTPAATSDCPGSRIAPASDCLWRLSVPQTAPVLALPAGVGAPLVEWHGGQRWVQAGPAHAAALRRDGGSRRADTLPYSERIMTHRRWE